MRAYDIHNNATGDYVTSVNVPRNKMPLAVFATHIGTTREALGDTVEARRAQPAHRLVRR